jgi:oxygen-independent coproporphyrinogen-3 oxidase
MRDPRQSGQPGCAAPAPATDPAAGRPPAAGLYLHIPFCLRKCPYCDFTSWVDPARHAPFLAALQAEMALAARFPARFDSLYFGGGTPTILSAAQLAALLQAARRHFAVEDGAEITIEANPGTVDPAKLAALRCAGFNRLSLGLQSLEAGSLRFLGRLHDARQACDAAAWARAAGFAQLSLDLIYGLPGQTPAGWRDELSRAAALEPQHLSCYLLTVEEGTPFGRQRRAGRLQLPGDRLQARLFETTRVHLERLGYVQYEISNFARRDPGGDGVNRSRHNSGYWSGAPYLGLGPSAHSYREPERWWNSGDLDAYLAALAGGRRPIAGRERLDRRARMLEALYLGLRQSDGIDLARFGRRFGAQAWGRCCSAAAETLAAEGRLQLAAGRCRLTPTARVLLDAVTARLAAALPAGE